MVRSFGSLHTSGRTPSWGNLRVAQQDETCRVGLFALESDGSTRRRYSAGISLVLLEHPLRIARCEAR
jgi:hypothetical protein